MTAARAAPASSPPMWAELSIAGIVKPIMRLMTITGRTPVPTARLKTFEDSTRDIETRRLTDLTSTRAEISKSIDRLGKLPSLAARSDELISDLLRIMQEQYDLIQDIQRSGVLTLDRKSTRLNSSHQIIS